MNYPTKDDFIKEVASHKLWGESISQEEYADLKEDTNIEMWNEGMEDDPKYMYDGATDNATDAFEYLIRQARKVLEGHDN